MAIEKDTQGGIKFDHRSQDKIDKAQAAKLVKPKKPGVKAPLESQEIINRGGKPNSQVKRVQDKSELTEKALANKVIADKLANTKHYIDPESGLKLEQGDDKLMTHTTEVEVKKVISDELDRKETPEYKAQVEAIAKTLQNTDQDGARKNVTDMVTFGGDLFKLLSKASSEREGWMKSTKAMEVDGKGCMVQVTTQQRNMDSSYSIAEALSFMPGVKIVETKDSDGIVTSRKLAGVG